MNLYHFLVHDTGYQAYLRNSYPANQISTEGTSNSFDGSVVVVSEDNNKKTICIDNAVQITTVSDKIFKDCQNFWTLMKVGVVFTGIVAVVLSAAVIGTGLAIGFVYPPLFIVTEMITYIAPIAILLGIIPYLTFKSRLDFISTQQKNWTPQLEKIIERRKKIPEKKFDIIITKKKYRNLVSESELQNLWKLNKSSYSPLELLTNSNLKKYLSSEELVQIWEENKKNFTLQDVLNNSILKGYASKEDLEAFWAKEFNLLFNEAQLVQNGTHNQKGKFVQTVNKSHILSTDNIPSRLLNGPNVSILQNILIFNIDYSSQDLVNTTEQGMVYNQALTAMSASYSHFNKPNNNAWYNSPVATSSLHATVMDLGAAYDVYSRSSANLAQVERISSNAKSKINLIESRSSEGYARLFPSIMDIFQKLNAALI